MKKSKLLIVGAGPAGLGAGYELTKGRSLKKGEALIVDKNDQIGGLARTHSYKSYYFDVGPHRFYTKNQEVLSMWKKTLGRDFIKVKRLTRILYKKKLLNYPVKLKDVVLKLGPIESAQSLLSFIYAKAFLRNKETKTFEDWITKNFGAKLYRLFFKTYTEKVWGIPCNQIGQEWAAQRIKNLNFIEVIKNAIFGEKVRKAKSLVESFDYPVKGAGYMYEKLASKIKKKGISIQLDNKVTRIYHKNKKIYAVDIDKKGKKTHILCDSLMSSMPLTHFINSLHPLPPRKIVNACLKLYYRDHITVNLIIKKDKIFPDNWIYVHDPSVKMARIANYNNFSTKMRKEKGHSAISVEYFSFQSDDIWKMKDLDLIELAKAEMDKVELIRSEDVIGGFVVRETESYPTYYLGHKKYFDLLKNYSDQFKNLYLIGRAGMYKYNNMDHSIYTGMLAIRNYKQGFNKYNIWRINEDAEYLEEKR